MKRVLLAGILALGLTAGGWALWQLSAETSRAEIDAHLRAEATTLRNRIMAELRAKEAQTDAALATIRAQHRTWTNALPAYPSPLLQDGEAQTRWLTQRLIDLGASGALANNTAFGVLHDQGSSLALVSASGGAFIVPHRGAGIYKAPGSDRLWLARAMGDLAPAPLATPQRSFWFAVELDEPWFTQLALQTQATLVVMGASGVVSSHGPADVVANLIHRLGTKGADRLFADATGGRAGARVGLGGTLEILATVAETKEIRHIDKRYSQASMAIIAALGASYVILLLWLAIAGLRRRPKGTQAIRAQKAEEDPLIELARTTEVKLARGETPHPPLPQPRVTSAPLEAISAPRHTGGSWLGRYQLLGRIGEGGMAEVFSAVNVGLEGFHRIFVLKRLKPHLLSHEGLVNQFIDEAKLAASLQHTNILSVLDFGCDAEQYFMVTDHVWGRNIGQLLEQAQARGLKALPLELAAYIAHELLQGLFYAHSQVDAHERPRNIVHRDVSVNNVMLSSEGNVKLLDFGIAKAYERSSNTTEQGVIKGNVLYMSPEQAQGLQVDHRSDVFSAGLVLLSMLTGQAPYRGTSQFRVLMEAARGPQNIPELVGHEANPRLVAILTKALQADPDLRYRSAVDFANDLRAACPMTDRLAASQFLTALFGDQLEQEKREVELAIQALPQPAAADSDTQAQAFSA